MVVGAMVVLAACVIVLLKGLRVLRMYRLFRGAKVVITTIVFGMLIVVLVRCARGPSPVRPAPAGPQLSCRWLAGTSLSAT